MLKGAFSCCEQEITDDMSRRRAAKEAALKKRFDQAKKAGDLPASANSAALARYLGVMAMGISAQASAGATAKELREVAAIALSFFPRRNGRPPNRFQDAQDQRAGLNSVEREPGAAREGPRVLAAHLRCRTNQAATSQCRATRPALKTDILVNAQRREPHCFVQADTGCIRQYDSRIHGAEILRPQDPEQRLVKGLGRFRRPAPRRRHRQLRPPTSDRPPVRDAGRHRQSRPPARPAPPPARDGVAKVRLMRPAR